MQDADAFAALYDREVQAVLVFIARRALDAELALDLTAETFAQAFVGRRSFRGTSEIEQRAWLFTIAMRPIARYQSRGVSERTLLVTAQRACVPDQMTCERCAAVRRRHRRAVPLPRRRDGDLLRAPYLRSRRRRRSRCRTFATAVRDRGQFRGRTDEETLGWLWGVARHQLSGWYRRGRVERRAMERLGVERRALSDPEYERIVELGGVAVLRGRVGKRLARLSGEQRAAVMLRVVEERSYAEVAAALGTSEQTARARVSRGLRALAAGLANDDAREVGARV